MRDRADLEVREAHRIEGKFLPSARLEHLEVDRLAHAGHGNKRSGRRVGGEDFQRFDILRTARFDEDANRADLGRTLESIHRPGQFVGREIKVSLQQFGRTVRGGRDDFGVLGIEEVARRGLLRSGTL